MSDKTEPATAKKRKDAAAEGDSLRSRDLGAAVSIVAFAAWTALAGGAVLAAATTATRAGLVIDRAALDTFETQRTALRLVALVAAPFAILAFVLVVGAILAGVVLGGGRWSGKAVGWRSSRLDPMKGFMRLFGREAWLGLLQSLVKVAALLALATAGLAAKHAAILALADQAGSVAGPDGASILISIVMGCAALAGAAALIDVLLQWRRREARLRMSKQEVRDEHKSNEGNPENKRAQRDRQYAIATSSARRAMGEATLVINNPLHFAVALRYRPDIDAVPIVVARGIDEAARAIRDLAVEHAVPQIDSPMLARAVYFTSRTGQPVATDLYLAVATVLAFVFNLEAEHARGRRTPDVVVPPTLRFGPDGKPTA